MSECKTIEDVKKLIAEGYDINSVDSDDKTLLHKVENAQVAKFLIENGSDVNAAPVRNSENTPLHDVVRRACQNEEIIEVIKVLLQHGAYVNHENNFGETPLFLAAEAGNEKVVKVLLEAGADVNSKCNTFKSYETPLHAAVKAGNVSLVKALLEAGADVNSHLEMENGGETPLHLAKDAEIVQLLIEAGADVNAKDVSERTPLHRCHGEGIRRILIEHGADINAKDDTKRTPLHCVYDDIDGAEALIEAGANVNAKDKHKETPLHWLAYYSSCDAKEVMKNGIVIETLIEHGADVNAQNSSKQTPLHKATEIGNVLNVKKLLEGGADAKIKDKKNMTALQYAETKYGRLQWAPDAVITRIIELLKARRTKNRKKSC